MKYKYVFAMDILWILVLAICKPLFSVNYNAVQSPFNELRLYRLAQQSYRKRNRFVLDDDRGKTLASINNSVQMS